MSCRKLHFLSRLIFFACVALLSASTEAASGSRDPCRADYAKLAQESTSELAAKREEEQRRILSWLRQQLFEYQEPNADLFHDGIRVGRYGEFTINRVMITGPSDYRLIDIKKHLGITEDYLHKFPSNAQVLSVGEGVSELAENLRMKFPNTKALDLWYDDPNLPKPLADFVATNRSHLIAGNATNMPVAARSKDLVVSHMLLNNLDSASQMKAIGEMIRVLKVGGEAKIAFANNEGEDVVTLLRRIYGDEIQVTGVLWKSDWKTGMMNHAGQTLTVRRLRN